MAQINIRELNYGEEGKFFPETHKLAVVGLDVELNNKANVNVYYESMGVGTAVNLAGQIERTNNSMYRTSGGDEDIATGTARIEKISGNTIAWNQLYKKDTVSYHLNKNWGSGSLADRQNAVAISYEFCLTKHKYLVISNFFIRRIQSSNLESPRQYEDLYTDYSINQLKKCIVTGVNNYPVLQLSLQCETGDNGTMTQDIYDNSFVNIFDLTLIYGEERANEIAAMSGNAGVEQFEADYQRWFGKPLTYEPYDKGSLKSVMLDGLKTVGFNQYNPTTGTVKLIGGNQYQITGTYTSLTLNGETITPDSNGKFTPSIDGTLTVTGGSTDTCVHLVWSGTKDGTYEPYEEHTISIPTTTMTGKLNGEGESVVIFPDGMKGVNDVHDEIYYVGGKTYAVKRVGRVDLGSFTWVIDTTKTYNSFFNNINLPNCKNPSETTIIGNYLCSKYVIASQHTWGINYDKKLALRTSSGLIITDSSYTDAATFKTAMSGVYFDYELAEPLVYELDDFTLPARYKVNDWGTEEQLQAEGANGVAAIISCLYGVNAVDLLRRLPENYISKESMDNFLVALESAMGGTWTKQWNEQNEEFDFSFVANSEQEANTEDLEPNNEGE